MTLKLAEALKAFQALDHLGVERAVDGIRSSIVSLDRVAKSSVGELFGARENGFHLQTPGQASRIATTNRLDSPATETTFLNGLRNVLSEYSGQIGERGKSRSPATTAVAGVSVGAAQRGSESETVFAANGPFGSQQELLRQLRDQFVGTAQGRSANESKQVVVADHRTANGPGDLNRSSTETLRTTSELHSIIGQMLKNIVSGVVESRAAGRSYSRGITHADALGNLRRQIMNRGDFAAHTSLPTRREAPSARFNIGELANRMQHSINGKHGRDMKKAADEAARQNEHLEQIITLIGQFPGIAFQ